MHEEAGDTFHTLLLDWEKAFDKVDHDRLIMALTRLGIPPKIINLIKAIYTNPCFTVSEGNNTSTERRHRAGIRQGCPLSPYLFILLLTVIYHDINNDLTAAQKKTLMEGLPHGTTISELFYADDTLIITRTAKAAQILLRATEKESLKYNLRLNYTKCIHIPMNDLRRVRYRNGQFVPTETKATYLGGLIMARGGHKQELHHRITSTWGVVKKLDLLWRRAPVSLKWKLRIYNAVIVNRVLYGLETIPLTQADDDKLDAFHYRGLRKLLRIKHSFWSRISNKEVIKRANERAKLKDDKVIKPLSLSLSRKQIALYAHLLRAPNNDPMKKVSFNEDGSRKMANWRRVGRPRTKWYDTTTSKVVSSLIKKGVIPGNWERIMRKEEINRLIVEAATERIL